MPKDQLLPVSTAAKAAGVSRATVQNWLRRGRLEKESGKVSLAAVVRCRDEWTTGRPPGVRAKLSKVPPFTRKRRGPMPAGVPSPHATRWQFELYAREIRAGLELHRFPTYALKMIAEELRPIAHFVAECDRLIAEKNGAPGERTRTQEQ